MKKVLILSYFYPPANFVGGDRIASWAKYLHEYGYYPVIVTRNWNVDQSDLTNKIENNDLHHEIYETHEIYRLPYYRSLRDRFNDYPNNPILSLVRKALSVIELIMNNFFVHYIPYSNIYTFAKKLITDSNQFDTLIVSGRPFQLFYFAYLLKKRTGINWIADYRDEWNTHPNRKANSFLEKMIHHFEKASELKWTSNCNGFISVSDHWVKTISEFIKKPGFKVMNGFEPDEFKQEVRTKKSNELIITYNGSLYLSQPIEIFIEAFKKIIDKYKDKIRLQVNFAGITVMPLPEQKVRKLIKGYEQYFAISNRISKQQIIELQMSSDLLLATGYNDVKGWYPVKIFEYYASGTPVLLCPSDNDVIEDFFSKTNTAYVKNTVEECQIFLSDYIEKKLSGDTHVLSRNNEEALKYTRKYQTGMLASVLSNIELN